MSHLLRIWTVLFISGAFLSTALSLVVGEDPNPLPLEEKAIATPTTYRPSGDTYTKKPTFSWKRISGATSYTLAIYDIATGTFKYTINISSTVCSTITNRCSYTPPTSLALNLSYKWKVRAKNSTENSAYSSYRHFKVLAGIYSTFTGSHSGWVTHTGGTWFNNDHYFYTKGVIDRWSSASYNKNFSNFTYEVRLKYGPNKNCPAGIVFRGQPVLNTSNDWKNTYKFQIYQEGSYYIVKTVNDKITFLKPDDFTSAIHKMDWNTLKVVADGPKIKAYINNELMWSGSDSTFSSGQVGVMTICDKATDIFYIDWVKLGMSEMYNK